MNVCENDVLTGMQQNNKRKEYCIGLTRGLMDIGNIRKKQEDSILITNHHEFNNKELLLVADGMGGLENGAKASRLATIHILNWFQNLDSFDLKSLKLIKDSFYSFAHKIDEEIRIECGSGGTTVVCALVLEDSILIVNIGDSRAYVYNDGEFSLITTDHSITQNLLDKGEILFKDDMRFHKKNNLILSRLGCEKKLLDIDFYEISRTDVDKLFLFSDGITDCLSDNRLLKIIRNSNEEEIGINIFDEVLYNDSYFCGLNSDEYYDKIEAGKDNMSLVYRMKGRTK